MCKIKVFVVSLERAFDRKAFISKQLKKLGLDYQYIDAYDSRKLSEEEITKINSNRAYFQDLTRGEIACAKSHVKACEALANDYSCDYGLIIEDDVILSTNLPAIFEGLVTSKLEDSVTLLCALIFKPVIISKFMNLPGSYGLVHPDNLDAVFGAQAYFLSKNKAGEFSRRNNPISTISDDWKYFVREGYFSEINMVYPFPILHAELLSAVNEKKKGKTLNIRTRIKNFLYFNRIPPFYQLFLLNRRRKAEEQQRKNISSPEFDYKKTYKI